jgi:hypothetical protein
MFVPSTRERQKISVSQITRGPNTARLSSSSKAITIRGRIIEAPCWDLPMGGTQMKR